jgi:beta-glucanase (GH16 family)
LEWNSDDNAKLSGHGGLIITANRGGEGHPCWYGPCEYTGVKIQTSFAQTYGRFEARIKLPAGRGLWPAFWMVPAATAQNPKLPGEIDVIEVNNHHPYLVSGYAHDGVRFNYKAEDVVNLPAASQFHTYGVDWTPSGITWTLDGKPYASIKSYSKWPFNQPFIMLLDLAVGGSWPGSPNASTVFPAQMLVSWVRVYKLES